MLEILESLAAPTDFEPIRPVWEDEEFDLEEVLQDLED